MKFLAGLWHRLTAAPKAHVPAEVRNRLRRHAIERQERMSRYAATWQRKWDDEKRKHNRRMWLVAGSDGGKVDR